MMSKACRSRLCRVLSSTFIATSLALGCAQPSAPTDEELALYEKGLDRWLERTAQLQTISQRIRVAGKDLCGAEISPVLGVVLIRVPELPRSLREAGKRRFGPEDSVRVIGVLEGFPAQRAGLRAGDEILGVDGNRVVSTPHVYGGDATAAPKLALRIVRGGETTEVSVENRLGCSYAAQLVDSEEINAYADGTRVVFFNGLLRAFVRDEPIALVMGHEIGHNIQTNTTGQRSGGVVGEARADYIGAYLAERAGYRLTRGDFGLAEIEFASPRRLVAKATTHPTGPARVLAFQRTLAEIASKRESGEALMPNVAAGPLR